MASLRGFAFTAVTIAIASLPATPASAQSGQGYLDFVRWCESVPGRRHIPGPGYGSCDPGSSTSDSPNLPFGLRPGWLRDLLTTDGDERAARASRINNQAIEADAAGNVELALTLFRRANAQNPGSARIRLNLMQELLAVGGRVWQQRQPNDPSVLDRIESLLNEAEGLDNTSLRGVEGYDTFIAHLRSGRSAIAGARQELARQAQNAAQLTGASERIAVIAGDINRSLAIAAPGASTSSLGFGDPGRVAPAPALGAQDGGRLLPNLPRLEEVENSPGREAWLRGMDAAARANAGNPREWDLALAWFQTALQRDPTNQALGQAVVLAEFTRDAARRSAALPPDVRRMVAGEDPTLMTPEDSDLAFLFQGETPLPEGVTTEELGRRDTANRLGMMLPEDLELVFTDTDQTRNNMVAGLGANVRARLAERGQGISAGDWTARLAPEIRGMVAELREALPPRTHGPQRPDASVSGLIATDAELIANAWASDAVVRILYGDLAGAERALNDAATLRGGLGPAIELVRRWRGEQQEGVLTGPTPGGAIRPERH